MDFKALKTELQDAKYTLMDDQTAANALNDQTISAMQSVKTSDIKKYLIMSGVWIGIRSSTSDTSITALDALDGFEQFDLTDPTILAVLTVILDSLVSEITVPDFIEIHKTTILGMGSTIISRASELNLDIINSGHVQAARGIL